MDSFVLNIKQQLNNNSEDCNKFKFEDKLLYFEKCLYIPNGPPRLHVLQACHDLLAVGHFEFYKTLELIFCDFRWLQMWKTTKDFVLFCDICFQSKSTWHRPYRVLQPLSIQKQPWSSISMNFITDLPPSTKFDTICNVVDWFSNMAHFIFYKETITGEQIARLFIGNIYRYHGLPNNIVFDHRPQFISKFWQSLFEILKVQIKLLSTFHPQIDGQTKWVNQVLEQYLWCIINYQQDDWTLLMPLTKFVYNNSAHASTHEIPFYINYDYHPKIDILLTWKGESPAVENFAIHLKELHEMMKVHLQEAQAFYKEFANTKWKQQARFWVGGKMWFFWRNFKTTRPCDKLDYMKIGPFHIDKQINNVAHRTTLSPSRISHFIFRDVQRTQLSGKDSTTTTFYWSR